MGVSRGRHLFFCHLFGIKKLIVYSFLITLCPPYDVIILKNHGKAV